MSLAVRVDGDAEAELDAVLSKDCAEVLAWERSAFDAAPVAQESYFPEDLFSLSPQEHFVDCGAYDGCTVRAFLNRSNGVFSRITALERDPTNCSRLREYRASLPQSVRDRFEVIQTAVGARRETARFNATGTMSSAVATDGQVEVESMPLDELLRPAQATYLKMDIEGAEPDALVGAREIIAAHPPLLAVCRYHRPDHLWTLPLLIRELHDGYRWYLRPHEPDGWQLVCYAVPDARGRG